MIATHHASPSDRIKALLPLVIAILISVLLLAIGNCQFETNDDMTMIRLLSGKNGLAATPDAVFLSLPLSALLYSLYQIAGNVPWYGLFLYGCLIAGCTIGLKLLLTAETALANKIICGIAFLGFYSYLVCQLNFAAVSLFLWLIVIAAITLANLNQNLTRGTSLIYGCLLAISFLIRPDILLVSLLFSAPAVATLPISSTKRNLAVLLVPLCIALAITTTGNHLYRSTPESRAYAKFNQSRSDLLDLHSGAPTGKTLAALTVSGWSIYDYILAGDWWLHDAKIYNQATFTSFTSQNSNKFAEMISADSSIQAVTTFKLPLVITLACLFLMLSSQPFTCRLVGWQRYGIWGAGVITLGALVLMSSIRFPPRVALPVFAYLVLLGVISSALFPGRRLARTPIHVGIAGVCAIAVAICTFSMLETDYRHRQMARQVKEFTDATLRQVMNNAPADTIMVTANVLGFSYNSEATHPLRAFRDSLSIIDFPSGWLIASPPYNAFLHQYGFVDRNHAVPRMIANDKVLFSYWQSPIENFELFTNNFLAHLRARYAAEFPGKSFQVETVLDNRGVKGNFGWVFFRLHAVP